MCVSLGLLDGVDHRTCMDEARRMGQEIGAEGELLWPTKHAHDTGRLRVDTFMKVIRWQNADRLYGQLSQA